MTTPKYDFRQFQEELARLERKVEAEKPAKPVKPPGKKAAAMERMARAREEFLVLRQRHDLSVADVVAFFPEEEGIAYLQNLIAAAGAKSPRKRKA
ncbi:MAG TPA: 2-hydroxyacyl-CoA dehydratase [Rhodanobacter sp.]|nr:2-hydroxyacyl-CoA dehydratase [Rhodanobacter sp.]